MCFHSDAPFVLEYIFQMLVKEKLFCFVDLSFVWQLRAVLLHWIMNNQICLIYEPPTDVSWIKFAVSQKIYLENAETSL